jgi:hypothetical protein
VSPDSDQIAAQISKTFIARRDVKAVQSRSGGYQPVTDTGKQPPDGERLPWKMADLRAHVNGKQTFGHYVVSAENTAKVFCFDIDLEKQLAWDDKRLPRWSIINPITGEPQERSNDARAAWFPTRLWQWCLECRKGWYPDYQEARCTDEAHGHTIAEGGQPDTLALTALLQWTAFRLASKIVEMIDVPAAVLYSGNKGIHVYGLVGEQPAADVRLAAELVLKSWGGRYEAFRGNNFYRDTDPEYEALSIEVFPKQESLEGKDLGNLLRLPLGVNRKSGNRSFFLESRILGQLSEMHPLDAMTGAVDPWGWPRRDA